MLVVKVGPPEQYIALAGGQATEASSVIDVVDDDEHGRCIVMRDGERIRLRDADGTMMTEGIQSTLATIKQGGAVWMLPTMVIGGSVYVLHNHKDHPSVD